MRSRLSHAASATFDDPVATPPAAAAVAAVPAGVHASCIHSANHDAKLQQERSSNTAVQAQQNAALQGLQQQLTDMQGGLPQALSRPAASSPKALSSTPSQAAAAWDANTTEVYPVPNPRASQPRPYPAAGLQSFDSSGAGTAAAAASFGGLQAEQRHAEQDMAEIVMPAASPSGTAAAAAAARRQVGQPASILDDRSISVRDSSNSRSHNHSSLDLNFKIQCISAAPEALDVTLSGGVPAAEASAYTVSTPSTSGRDSSPRSSASEQSQSDDSDEERDAGSPELCSSALFIEPSSTVCDEDAADLAFFSTPDVRARVGRHAGTSSRKHAQQHATADMVSNADDRSSTRDRQLACAASCKQQQQQQQQQRDNAHPSQSKRSSLVADSSARFNLNSSMHCRGSAAARQSRVETSIGAGTRSISASPHRGSIVATAAASARRPYASAAGYDVGVDAAPGDSHMVLVVRQHAKQLQQQNDALVRVLEREQQEHKRSKQKVSRQH
jgi:hypothetical protein